MAKRVKKFRKGYTHIAFVLDRSGSMSIRKGITIESTNEFIRKQQEVDAVAYPCTMTLVQFDNVYEVLYSFKGITGASFLTDESYQPRGSTALIDAMAITLEDTEKAIKKMKPENRPEKVVFVVQTDGEENASTKYTKDQLGEMLVKYRDKRGWEVIFLAADMDAIASASSAITATGMTGFTGTGGYHGYSGMMGYSGISGYELATTMTASNVANYRVGTTSTTMFSPEQQQELEEVSEEDNKAGV